MSVEKNIADAIEFSNVTVVRDREGHLSVYVGAEKMLGVLGVRIGDGALGMAVPMSRVRMMEDVPASPVIEYKDNIIIGNFTKLVPANDAAQTDGDTA